MTERTLLQLAVFILAWVPVTGGAAGVIFGPSLVGNVTLREAGEAAPEGYLKLKIRR